MKTARTLSIAIAFAFSASALAACSGGEPSSDDDVGGDDTDDPPDQTGVSPVGKYALSSEFDLASGLPGTVGDVVNELIAATDGADDPGRYLCDKAADALGGTLGDIAHGVCGIAGGYINDQILAVAPDFVDTLLQMADDFGQIARNFGLNSELEITESGQGFLSRHTVVGIGFKLDGQVHSFKLADYGATPVDVANVGLTYDTTGALAIAGHDVPMAYGTALRIGMDELIIPSLDPSATNLGEMFQNLVDCYRVGEAIYNAIGFGSVSTYESACEAGLGAAANLIYGKISDLDGSGMKFSMTGAARAMDTDGDKKVDEISRGTWTGNVVYGSTPAPLANSTFAGARM